MKPSPLILVYEGPHAKVAGFVRGVPRDMSHTTLTVEWLMRHYPGFRIVGITEAQPDDVGEVTALIDDVPVEMQVDASEIEGDGYVTAYQTPSVTAELDEPKGYQPRRRGPRR